MSTAHEAEMYARAQAIRDRRAVPVRVVAQHDWSRRRAALTILAANAVVQLAVNLLLR